MTDKPVDWLVTQGALGVMCIFLLAAILWIVRQWMNERKDCDTEKKLLHEAHKTELRENGKTHLAVTERMLSAIDRLSDLEERRRQ
jgi:hypothetical protein